MPARPAPSPPALRNRPARTSPPGMGPARPTGPACGPVTLSSDKTHSVCHVPSGPQLPLPSVSSSTDPGRRWQCLWPYQPTSAPWSPRQPPLASEGLAGLPRPSRRPRSVQNWFLWPGFDPWASDCSAGFGRQSSAAPPQGPSRHPLSTSTGTGVGGLSSPGWLRFLLPPRVQGGRRGPWCQPASTSAPSSGRKPPGAFPAEALGLPPEARGWHGSL